MNLSILKVVIRIVLYFFFYAFLGWILDTFYSSLVSGQIEFGGMFKSFLLPIPLAPIYGFGALLLISFYNFLKERGHFSLFFISGFLLTILEYIGGHITVFLFNHRAWDYTRNFFNLGGYIDLWHSFLWTMLGWFFVRYLHPANKVFFEKVINEIINRFYEKKNNNS